jgi:membrane protein required for colicin V production
MLAQLTGWDWFVIAVLTLSVGIGLLRGLVRTIFAVGAWLAGLVGSAIATPQLWLHVGETVPVWLIYLATFLLLFLTVRLLGTTLARAMRGVGLGGADRLLGGVLGAARAMLIVLLVAVGGHVGGFSREPAWQRALSRPLLDAMVYWVEPLLPERITGIRRT